MNSAPTCKRAVRFLDGRYYVITGVGPLPHGSPEDCFECRASALADEDDDMGVPGEMDMAGDGETFAEYCQRRHEKIHAMFGLTPMAYPGPFRP